MLRGFNWFLRNYIPVFPCELKKLDTYYYMNNYFFIDVYLRIILQINNKITLDQTNRWYFSSGFKINIILDS